MAFWGVELKPGKPYIHHYDDGNGRLRVSQATLGSVASSANRSIVQCRVGDKRPIYLCSLLPEKLETCALNLEFEEDEEVAFSVIGPNSVHLSGFFYGENEDQNDHIDHYGSDSSDEDIMMVTDSEDDEDEDEDDDFTDGELGEYPPSPVPNSGVRIEEIVDDEKPAIENGNLKNEKKKKNQSSLAEDDRNSGQQIVVKSGTNVPVLESEDEDGFPVSTGGSKVEKSSLEIGEKVQKKKVKDNDQNKSLKRKMDDIAHIVEHARKDDKSTEVTEVASLEDEAKLKEKNKKKKMDNGQGAEETGEGENDHRPANEKKKEKKKKQKQKKKEENAAKMNLQKAKTDENDSSIEKEEKAAGTPLKVRSYPNGLVVEQLAMGKPDGKKASPGTKVSVHYIGKLKKTGKIFDSNVGRAPFKFRLGVGQVIKGWDVGVQGMRVGDKRRLTIPPAMGYGAKGAGPAIPPNSWLVFDVELVGVH